MSVAMAAFGTARGERGTMPTRRVLLRGLGGAGVAAAVSNVPAAALAVGGRSQDPVFTFASLPDFFNGDVADLSVLPSWDGGTNSVNEYWLDAIDHCLGAVAAHRPDAVFVAGDAVEGHWNIDSDDRQLFGPVSRGTDPDSLAKCTSAITTAGGVHYDFYADLFSSRGLTLYPAIGDHELLDDRAGALNDRWSPGGFHKGVPDNRFYLVDHCKSVWADHFTRANGTATYRRRPVGTTSEYTAYAVSFADALTLITVDMFMRHETGVRLGVFHGQLHWLTQEIRRAKRRGHVVVVQGHMPVMWPARHFNSGRLRLPEGRRSSFYQTLDREGVDLFLCGEVHDSTAIQHGRRSPLQISHGCIFQDAFPFLVGRLYEDGRLVLDLYETLVAEASAENGLWSCDAPHYQRTYLEYAAPRHRGRIVQHRGEVLKATDKLGGFHPKRDPFAFEVPGNLGTTVVSQW
jgi:Calcineurin-like phosphoesterase